MDYKLVRKKVYGVVITEIKLEDKKAKEKEKFLHKIFLDDFDIFEIIDPSEKVVGLIPNPNLVGVYAELEDGTQLNLGYECPEEESPSNWDEEAQWAIEEWEKEQAMEGSPEEPAR